MAKVALDLEARQLLSLQQHVKHKGSAGTDFFV